MDDRFKFSKKPTPSAQRFLANTQGMDLENNQKLKEISQDKKRKKGKKKLLPIKVSQKIPGKENPLYEETAMIIEHYIDENGKWIGK